MRIEQFVAALRHYAQPRWQAESFAALVEKFRLALLRVGFGFRFGVEKSRKLFAAFILPSHHGL